MKYALITDHRVEELYGKRHCSQLQEKGYDVELFSFPAGEKSKNRQVKESLEDALLSRRYTKDTTIIALGGGVVTDLVGFLASTFCRGVSLILIPTTLLAIVDASIGGKSGVNTLFGKNMIGSFYQPEKIVINLAYLATLPEEEWFNGKSELLKAALIGDPELFYHFSKISFNEGIERARAVKQRIVNLDPFEKKGIRSLLNLGHTLGHAIELVSQYKISHGKAVAMGIVLEAQLAYEMNLLPKRLLKMIIERFPAISETFDIDLIFQALYSDKKTVNTVLKFTLLRDIGKAITGVEVSHELIRKILL